MSTTTAPAIRLGLRENLPQFMLLVGVNALVGGMIGQERTVLPLLATDEFGLTRLHRHPHVHRRVRDREGHHQLLRRHPVGPLRPQTRPGRRLDHRHPRPPPAHLGAEWSWVVFANVLLGVNQGLTWSTTVIMKIDLVGPARRGYAMGLNEAAGYGAVAITALATGWIAAEWGCAPHPSTSASPTPPSVSASPPWP
jgi:MFS family permease